MAVSVGGLQRGIGERARTLAAAQGVDPLGTLVGGLAVVVFVGLLGIVHVAGIPHTWFIDLDAEFNLPAIWSGGLLLVAAALSIELRHHTRLRPVMALAGLFAFMGLDEIMTIHEHLQAWTGVRWELLYVPVVALAALGCTLAWPRLQDAPWARAALAWGALWWAGAQLLEWAQWDGDVPVPSYDVLMVCEEVGEMIGSLLFIVALLCIRRAWLVRPRSRPV